MLYSWLWFIARSLDTETCIQWCYKGVFTPTYTPTVTIGHLLCLYPYYVSQSWCQDHGSLPMIRLANDYKRLSINLYLSVSWCIFSDAGTKLDPTLCWADRLVRQVLGAMGALPDIYAELELEISYGVVVMWVKPERKLYRRGRKGTSEWMYAYLHVDMLYSVMSIVSMQVLLKLSWI